MRGRNRFELEPSHSGIACRAPKCLLTPLDNDGVWFRYHTLLAEYLKQRLEADRGIEIPELNGRAALWYASHELWTEAVQHAIAAGASDRAIGWINNCAMALIKRGDLFTLLEWQRQFPRRTDAGSARGQVGDRLGIGAQGYVLMKPCSSQLK